MPKISHEEGIKRSRRILLFGSRSFSLETDYKIFKEVMDEYMLVHDLFSHDDFCFITGKASKGADAFIIQYAEEKSADWMEYPANWNPNPNDRNYVDRGAGFKRNVEMGNVATEGIGFWDFHSNGSRHMYSYLVKRNLPVVVIVTAYRR